MFMYSAPLKAKIDSARCRMDSSVGAIDQQSRGGPAGQNVIIYPKVDKEHRGPNETLLVSVEAKWYEFSLVSLFGRGV